MSRTTIAVQTPTRERISAAAQAESTTIDAFLSKLLDEHEERQFWASMQDVTPAIYRASLAEDGMALDHDYSLEDRAIEAQEAQG